MDEVRFHGYIKNKRFYLDKVDRKRFDEYVSDLPNGKYCFDFMKYHEHRTRPQLKYYWKLLKLIGDHIGEHPESVHSIMKGMYLVEYKIITLADGQEMEVPAVKSVADKGNSGNTNVVEMIKYIDKVIEWVQEFCPGFKVPDPKDYKGEAE